MRSFLILHFTFFLATFSLASIGAKKTNNEWRLHKLSKLDPLDQLMQQPDVERIETVLERVCDTNPCLNEGVCTPAGTSFSCKCPWGWTGLRCEICLTECASSPCPANKRCKAIFGGGYECVCPPNRSGPNCDIQLDLCAPSQCLNGGKCRALINGRFQCECARPWSGERCEQIFQNPCTVDVLREPEIRQFPNPWDRAGYLICVDVNEYHAMSCSTGTIFNQKLNHCVPDGFETPECPSTYCRNDGECVKTGDREFKCLCRAGFEGDRCQTNTDECVTQAGNLACVGGTCIDQVNGYYCLCENERIGLNCVPESVIENPCNDPTRIEQFHQVPSQYANVYLRCQNGMISVRKCASNLFWNQQEQTCSVERPEQSQARSSLVCANGIVCINGECLNEQCACKQGWEGESCAKLIDYCESSPCKNGGRCLSYPGGHSCICQDNIVDECCCNGILNPCPQKSINLRIADTLYPHLFPNRYIQCDHDGRGFVKSCPPKMRWNQQLLTCLPNKKKTTNSLLRQEPKQQTTYSTVPLETLPVQYASYTTPEIKQSNEALAYNVEQLPMPVESRATFEMPIEQNKSEARHNAPSYSQQTVASTPVQQQEQLHITPELLLKLVQAGFKLPDSLVNQLMNLKQN